MKKGQGNFKWANGASYDGELANNEIHGEGYHEWP